MRKKRYADAFKKQLIALVAQGRTPEQLAREYEPTAQTIRNWVNEAQKQQPASELEKEGCREQGASIMSRSLE